MSIITIYHGSDEILEKPLFGKGKPDNDYGSGFYTTEDKENAKEWAVVNGTEERAICNEYEIDLNNLNVLHLDNYGTLAWIAEIIYNRGVNDAFNEEFGQIIVDKYKIDTSKADVIIGYRADDSYIDIIDAFLDEKFTITEVDKLFREGKLGLQVFIKSEKAFNAIVFKGFEKVKEVEKYGKNESIARQKVIAFLNAREHEIRFDRLDISSLGLTVFDAISQNLQYIDGHYTPVGDENNRSQGGYDYEKRYHPCI